MKNAEQKLIENEAFNILILFYFYTIYFLVNIFQKYIYASSYTNLRIHCVKPTIIGHGHQSSKA